MHIPFQIVWVPITFDCHNSYIKSPIPSSYPMKTATCLQFKKNCAHEQFYDCFPDKLIRLPIRIPISNS